MLLLRIGRLLRDAGRSWYEDRTFEMGAALAFYAAFSAAPILLFSTLIASRVFDPGLEQGELAGRLKDVVSAPIAQAIVHTMHASAQAAADWSSLFAGSAVLLIGAVGLFTQLQDTMNSVWKVKPDPRRSWWTMVRQRLPVAFMVLGVIILFVLAILANTVMWLLAHAILPDSAIGSIAWTIGHWLFSLLVLTILVALIFKVLPEAEIAWSDVWIGSAVTAVLFTGGNYLIGVYLAKLGLASAYGPAGSWLVLLLWAFYASQAFLFGATLTRMYADQHGHSIQPAQGAVPAPEAGRA